MSMHSKVKLRSSDDEVFEIDELVAFESQTIKYKVQDTGYGATIPIPDVSSKILEKVIEYCEFLGESKQTDDGESSLSRDEIELFEADFVKVDNQTLFDLMSAASYLDIQNLSDLTFQTVADMIKSKTPEEIRKVLNIKNDFTPEEEEAVRRENEWAFQ